MRNIAIFAHVDAGKTTVSEQLMLHAGAIRNLGKVDEGTAHTDRLEVERRRGISVQSSGALFSWKGEDINLIDTPGHSDFSAEVERSLWAPDGAILVISAAEGVQPQTENLFRALQETHIPTLLFFNKTDRQGASVPAAMQSFRRLLSKDGCLLSDKEGLMAALGEYDEQVMEDYLMGEIYPNEKLLPLIRKAMENMQLFPGLSGSALKDEGIEELLDAIITLLPSPGGTEKGPLCAVVFAAHQDATLGRGVQVRIFSGALQNRDVIPWKDEQRKITQIRLPSPDGRGKDAGRLSFGQIGTLYGLSDLPVGTVLGDETLLPRKISLGAFREPLIAVKAEPENPSQAHDMRKALQILSGEDPLLQLQYNRETQETTLRAMGKMHLEILEETMRTRFSIPCTFSKPQLIYRETLLRPTEGFVAYTMPKPCWAIMNLYMEPLPPGSGVQFESRVSPRDIALRYQHQVENALPLALKQGMRGFQVTDIRITLTGGNHHEIHTHPLDFVVATPMAVMDGLQRGGTRLLEPVLHCCIQVPETYAGKVMSDVTRMRGEVQSTQPIGETCRIEALVPAVNALPYADELLQMTGGRGGMTTRVHAWQYAPPDVNDTLPRHGVNPLDTAKYILAARSALEGDIFDR